jgi:acetoin utilization deacetylase AcuC-like enzyme
MTVHICWHPSSLDHHPGPAHPESPERLAAVLDGLRAVEPGVELIWHESEAVPMPALLRVHPATHVDRLHTLAAIGGGRLDPDTAMSRGSFAAAVHAAGAALQGTRLALDSGTSVFVPVRPPGHHATADHPMGFCLLNNVVVAARNALEEWGAARVLIVDWDVHHGNGTQALVERDDRVRYVSLHQWPWYPGTGPAHERGVGNIFNLPRPPGLPRSQYVGDLQAAVERAVDGWNPDLILLSAGFDALAGDPLGGFTLEPEDYATWVTSWKGIDAPIVSVLEGGYAPQRVAAAAVAHVRALS